MKVGIALGSKRTTNAQAALHGFLEGIEKDGDEVVTIKDLSQIGRISKCDVGIQCCEYNEYKNFKDMENSLRFHLMRWSQFYEKPRIILDTGFLLNQRYNTEEIENRYFQVGLNGIKRQGVIKGDFDDIRWQHIKSQLEFDCRSVFNPNFSGPILILGQYEKGTSVQNENITKWTKDIVDEIHSIYDNEILLLPHPNQKKFPSNTDKYRLQATHSELELTSLISSSYFCVCFTTNASVYPILLGKPLFCFSDKCIAWEMSGQDLYNLFNYVCKVDSWCNSLAYQQWNIEEMASGDCWQFIRPYLET